MGLFSSTPPEVQAQQDIARMEDQLEKLRRDQIDLQKRIADKIEETRQAQKDRKQDIKEADDLLEENESRLEQNKISRL